MGFPNAAGLYDQNLGLMDQRLALEWVVSSVRCATRADIRLRLVVVYREITSTISAEMRPEL